MRAMTQRNDGLNKPPIQRIFIRDKLKATTRDIKICENLRRDLLTVHQHAKWGVSDKRDMFYAFYGIYKRWFGASLPVLDYAKSVEEVFADFTLFYTAQVRSFDLLRCVSLFKRRDLRFSWVTDLSNINTEASMWFRNEATKWFKEDFWEVVIPRPKILIHARNYPDSPRWPRIWGGQIPSGIRNGEEYSWMMLAGSIIDVVSARAPHCFGYLHQLEKTLAGIHQGLNSESCLTCHVDANIFRSWITFGRQLEPQAEETDKYKLSDGVELELIAAMSRRPYSDFETDLHLVQFREWRAVIESPVLPCIQAFVSGVEEKVASKHSKVKQTTRGKVDLNALEKADGVVKSTKFHSKVCTLHANLLQWNRSRALFATKPGRLGTTFATVQQGDLVVRITNYKEDVVLRLRSDGKHHEFIGLAFIPSRTKFATVSEGFNRYFVVL